MSFRLKIILGIIIIQALLLIVLISISLNFLRFSNEIELSKRASSLANLFAVTAHPLMLSQDQAALRELSNTILGQPGVEYARIRTEQESLVEVGDAAQLQRPFVEDFLIDEVTDDIYDTYAEITDGADVLGYVEIGLSVAEIANVAEAARRQISTVALIGMAFSVLMAILLGNYFARQLKTLRDAARSIASGNIGYQLFIRGQDELAQTANAFNTMSRKLALLYSEKQAALNRAENTTAELRENERRIQTILNHAMDGIITIDELGYIDTFNPAAEKIFGYLQAEVLGQSVTMLMPDRMRDRQEAFLRDYLSTGTDAEGGDRQLHREFIGKRKDGATFPMELDISEVDVEGRSLYIGIVRDITERKRAEQELRDAKDSALESARAKFEFIANVSHELRAPMKGVLGNINMLQHTSLNDLQNEYVHQINDAGDRLITIVNDILDFSRLESEQMKIESIDFDLPQIVENVCRRLRPAAQRKGLQLTYFIPCLVPFALKGDPARLRQILMNLVDNAIKYTEKGEVLLRVEPVQDEEHQVQLKFFISDTGIGLSPKAQRRIFESYISDPSQPAAARGGTGLGLDISRRLVEMMDGDIGVESERGRGSTFWFTVTLEKQPPLPDEGPTRYAELRGLKVLVVDNRPAWREFLHKLMATAGMVAHDADAADGALEVLIEAAEDDDPYDMVIFDMTLPDLNGLELARRIRGNPEISDTRLIMVATTGYRGDSEEVRAAGINGYLTTPIKETQLYGCMLGVMHVEEDSAALVTRHNIAAPYDAERGQVLIVEEDGSEQKTLLGLIEDLEFRPYLAASSNEAIEALSRQGYEYVIVDCEMEYRDHFRVTDYIRDQKERHPERDIKVFALAYPDTTREKVEQCLSGGVVIGMLDAPVSMDGLRKYLSAA